MNAAQARSHARQVLQTGIGKIARWAEPGNRDWPPRSRPRPRQPPRPGPAVTERPSYGHLWEPASDDEAIARIYNTTDWHHFDEGGRGDEQRLAPLYDASSSVLDLGCGIGRVAQYVAPKCKDLWAVDASQRMLNIASRRMAGMTNIRYARCLDVSIPDVPDASVDLAYSFLVLQHVEREDAFLLLEELRRVVKPSGSVVVTYPNLLSDTYLDCFVNYAHARATNEVQRARTYTPQEVTRLMEAALFDVELEVETEIVALARPR